MKKTIFITGASSGIGKASAEYFAANGWNVAATMRNPKPELFENENISVYKLDVTEKESIKKAKELALDKFGKIDIVLNNAGYGLAGTLEELDDEKIKRQFDTNLFGVMNVTREFIPHFRENKSGMFMNVTSVGGLMTFPFFGMYHATKWALEGLSESLAYDLAKFGIKIKIIEPGGVKTDFATRSLDMGANQYSEFYKDIKDHFMKVMMERAQNSNSGSTAEYLAEKIYEAATDGKDQLRYLIGEDAKEFIQFRNKVGVDEFLKINKKEFLGLS